LALEKIEITPLDKDGNRIEPEKFRVLFNPNTYTVVKTVAWTSHQSDTDRKLNAPTLSFGGGASRQLTLELFYDVTEPLTGLLPVFDVRQETNRIVELTRIRRGLDRPPAVEITWGNAPPSGSDFPFIGVISSLTQRFTLFTTDGRPVRATLTVVLQEFLDPELDKRHHDPEFMTRLVRSGEDLTSIAAEVYHDPTLWRVLAEANNIDDPRRLPVGLVLAIPKRD
jgi:hypothetical protein